MAEVEFVNVEADEPTEFMHRLAGIVTGAGTPFDGAFVLGLYTAGNGSLRVAASWKATRMLSLFEYQAVADRLEVLAKELRRGPPEARVTTDTKEGQWVPS